MVLDGRGTDLQDVLQLQGSLVDVRVGDVVTLGILKHHHEISLCVLNALIFVVFHFDSGGNGGEQCSDAHFAM